MIIKRQIGEKGQVVIPRDIRELLNLSKGSEVIFDVQNNKVEIKQEQNPEEYLKDFLDTPKLKKKISMKEIKKTILEGSERYEKIY